MGKYPAASGTGSAAEFMVNRRNKDGRKAGCGELSEMQGGVEELPALKLLGKTLGMGFHIDFVHL